MAPGTRPFAEWHALSGWGRAVWAAARVARPRTAEDVAALLAHASAHGRRVTVRGAGRSYGDAALPADLLVLDPSGMRRVLAFEREQGHITVEPGVTIEQLWRTVLPAGWWPPVVPGTMRPTIGGCVAMNVHGKNQFRAGSIGEHVDELEIVLASGVRRVVSATRDVDLFRAVVGGAGLLGVIVSISLRLVRITSGHVDVVAAAHRTLGAMAADMDARCGESDYVVGWVDGFSKQGRGVVHAACHAAGGDANRALRLEAQDLPDRLLGVVPRERVALLMHLFAHPLGMRAVNGVKYRLAALRGEHRFRQSHAAFHFLLDYVPGWRSIYDPGGLIQHQSFLPVDVAGEVHTRLITMCRAAGLVPWLAVYKRHRPDAFLLSHAIDGFSLALDLRVTAANRERLWRLCGEMDRVVLDAGGRFYLAKDLTMSPETARSVYPGLPRFREWKRELDPESLLTSALAERLRLLV